MSQLKSSFENLVKNDKPKLILVIVHLGLAFLFFIGMLMPFLVGETIINGHVSLVKMFLNLGAPVIITYLVFMLLYAYTTLSTSEKNSRVIFLILAIISTIALIWGLLVVGVGDTGGKLGVGFIVVLVMLVGMWFTHFKENTVKDIIKKFIKNEVKTESSKIEEN